MHLALVFALALAVAAGFGKHAVVDARAQEVSRALFGGDGGLFATDPPSLRGTRDPRVYRPVVMPVRVPVAQLGAPSAKQVRRSPPGELDSLSPHGIRLGVMTLRPTITQSVGFESMRTDASSRSDTISRIEGGMRLDTDWLRHAFAMEVSGRYDTVHRSSERRISGTASGRLSLDVRHWLSVAFDVRGTTGRDFVGTPVLLDNLTRSQTDSVAGRGIVEARGARATLAMRGAVTRMLNGNAQQFSGTTLSRRGEDYVEPSFGVRVAYRVTPGLEPFVDAEIDKRSFVDRSSSGDRDSIGLTGRVGARAEVSALLVGTASLGWQRRRFLAPDRAMINGFLAQGSLTWLPAPFTRVRFGGESGIAETGVPGARGAQTVSGTIGVTHQLSRTVRLDTSVGLLRVNFSGVALREDLLTASVAADWRLTRSLAVNARYTHERLKSNAPGGGYRADRGLIGVQYAP